MLRLFGGSECKNGRTDGQTDGRVQDLLCGIVSTAATLGRPDFMVRETESLRDLWGLS